jgi:hypothetical protein
MSMTIENILMNACGLQQVFARKQPLGSFEKRKKQRVLDGDPS